MRRFRRPLGQRTIPPISAKTLEAMGAPIAPIGHNSEAREFGGFERTPRGYYTRGAAMYQMTLVGGEITFDSNQILNDDHVLRALRIVKEELTKDLRSAGVFHVSTNTLRESDSTAEISEGELEAMVPNSQTLYKFHDIRFLVIHPAHTVLEGRIKRGKYKKSGQIDADRQKLREYSAIYDAAIDRAGVRIRKENVFGTPTQG